MHKPINSFEDTDDLSYDFDRDRNRRQQELTTNKRVKRQHSVRFYLIDVFDFGKQQEEATNGRGLKLT